MASPETSPFFPVVLSLASHASGRHHGHDIESGKLECRGIKSMRYCP